MRFGPENHRTHAAALKRPFCGCVLYRTSPARNSDWFGRVYQYAQARLLCRPNRGNRPRRDLSRCPLNSAASLKFRNGRAPAALSNWQAGETRLQWAGCRPRPIIHSAPQPRRWPGPHRSKRGFASPYRFYERYGTIPSFYFGTPATTRGGDQRGATPRRRAPRGSGQEHASIASVAFRVRSKQAGGEGRDLADRCAQWTVADKRSAATH